MEIDGDLEVVRVAIAAGALLHRGDLGVQSLGNGIGNAMREVSQDVRQMTGDQLGGRDHRRQATMRRPEVPSLPELHRPRRRLVAPQLPQRLLECPCPAGLEFGGLQLREALTRLVGHVLRVGQPQVLALGQRGVTGLQQRLVLLLSDLVDGIELALHSIGGIERQPLSLRQS